MTAPSPPHGPLVVLPFLDGPRTIVVLAGDADTVTASRLHEQLVATLGPRTRSLVVDLTDLAVRDERGVAALRAAVDVAESRRVAVSLRGASPEVAQVLGTPVHQL